MLRLLAVIALAALSSALYPSNSTVIELTSSNFDGLVIKSDEVWIVEFFAPWCGHCQALAPEYTKAASALKGVVKVGAVNVEAHKELGSRYGVRGFPTIKIFGADKNKPEDYRGARSAQGLVDGALQAVKAKVTAGLGGKSGPAQDVIQLTDNNFDKLVLKSDDLWLVEFFAPWCGHCKSLAPHWAKAASELKGKVKLGALDATAHQAQATKYGIEGYPTIKFFAPGKKASNYDGGRTSSEIVTWALEKLAENVPAPDVSEILGETTFATCNRKPLCVVSILPHILDCQSECRNQYLKILKELGEKYKKTTWGWVWAEAGAQVELEGALDIGGFGYPAMAVLNARKMKYSTLRGAFSKDGINEFLRDLSYGRGNTSPVKGRHLPDIIITDAWDGKDAELPPDPSGIDSDDKDEL